MQLPILIFEGNPKTCYGILNSFSAQLRDAFISLGEDVIYVDPSSDFITEYANREYKAIIAFMEIIFDRCMPGTNKPLFDYFKGPKFNYWPDHPSVFYLQMNHTPKDYYILTHDRNYVNFINRYYTKATAFFLPLGGIVNENPIPFSERKYSVSFLGSYKNWKEVLGKIAFQDFRDIYINTLIENTNLTAEAALQKTLDQVGVQVGESDFLKLLYQAHWFADGVVAALYREMIIETILNEHIHLDVFGDSWYNSPFSSSQYLHIHPQIAASDIPSVYSDSKISLNIMNWHKDSITERVLDAMLSGCIVLTDTTPALEEAFIQNSEILFFSLSDIKSVPSLITSNLNNEPLAQRGHKEAQANHTWKNRAQKLLEIINTVTTDSGRSF